MHSFEKRFETVWSGFPLVAKRPLVVAVSGGVDSVCLLHLLQKQVDPSLLVVAHFDHQVRPTSSQEAIWVKKEARSMGIRKVIIGERKANKLSEDALRKERHQFFQKVLKSTKAQAIVLAHHADDQLETVLMRLLRGTRLEGLGGMKEKQGNLWRPLLGFSKQELLDYSKNNRISFCEDETNSSLKFLRNRVRAQVLPSLKSLSAEYGGENRFLNRLSELLKEIQSVSDHTELDAKKWCEENIEETSWWWTFSQEAWEKNSPFLQKRIAERLWLKIADETLETKELKQFLCAIETSKRTVLSGNVELTASCGRVYLVTQAHKKQQAQLRKKGPWQGVKPLAQRKALQKKIKDKGLELRFLQAGDTFRGKKMKRRCWEEQIPSVQRPLLPVLAPFGCAEIQWYFGGKRARNSGLGSKFQAYWLALDKT